MNNLLRIFTFTLLPIFLIACGGSNSDSNDIAGVDGIRENIITSNMSGGFPWNGSSSTRTALKIWSIDVDGLIPVKHKNIPEAIYALNEIEMKTGKILFDRNSIINTPDQEVERGLVFSFGTALGPNGVEANGCGHVGAVGGSVSYPQGWYDADGHIQGPLQVNIDSDQPGGCTNGSNMNKIAVHEVGHALGLGAHFTGFGIGDIYDDNMWNALYNMYRNQPLTDIEGLTIEKAF
ncbi:hypothetical protein [Zhongshania borealis]|uniref:Peptidase M10 metallopeptidase domain-containing protein n=1 Tax=Zhongshania borealis TaxID=889488 RepID=A0ABP7WR52_9GAMM